MGELVSVVVLSYARPSLLRSALDGLSRQTYSSLDVIVVDNFSEKSREVKRVVAQYPRFRLVALNSNTGFTGGMRAGLLAARGPFALLTEDDIVLDQDCIEVMVNAAHELPGPGLFSGPIRDRGAGTVRYAGGHVQLGPALRLTLTDGPDPSIPSSSTPQLTGYVPGCFIFGGTEYLSKLGPFREEFFLYQEDVELCLRVLERGESLWFLPGARCAHAPARSASTDPEIEFHKLKNSLAVYALHAAPLVALEYWLRVCVRALRALRSDPQRGLTFIRALGWGTLRLPGLVRDRACRRASIDS
jgi:GT2 family glycosyltransferase